VIGCAACTRELRVSYSSYVSPTRATCLLLELRVSYSSYVSPTRATCLLLELRVRVSPMRTRRERGGVSSLGP